VNPEILARLRKIGPQSQCLVKLGLRLALAPELTVGNAQIVVGFRPFRSLPERPFETRRSLARLAARKA
jgi:hypothetical protein